MERDHDIEFDFFDEPEASEAPAPQRRAPRRAGPRRPIRPATGLAPLLRLVSLIAVAILVVLVLVLWVQGCRDDAKKNSYRDYIAKVKTIAADSGQSGGQLTALLTTTGVNQAEAEKRLRSIAERERQNVGSAEELNSPGPLRQEHRHVVEALQLRVSGLTGMAETLRTTVGSKTLAADAELLAEQAKRLVASDVLWDDLFKDPAKVALGKQELTGEGFVPPDSNFVTTEDLDSVRTLQPFLQRLRGASTGGTPTGLHGTNIESVVALPANKPLVPGESNVVVATTDLGFAVAVKDSGDSQEVSIKVTLTIDKPGQPISMTETIALINAGETKTVRFRNVDVSGLFAQKTKLKVDVSLVRGESNKANNSAVYDVIFSLPE
jgi:hypothetical protein